jgi:hypothetical protein
LLAEHLGYFDAEMAQLKNNLDGAKAAKEDAYQILQAARAHRAVGPEAVSAEQLLRARHKPAWNLQRKESISSRLFHR